MRIVTPTGDPVRTASANEIRQPDRWQTAMKQAIRDPAELCRLLQLPPACVEAAVAAAADFPLFVPREFVAKMTPGDPHDPLLLQTLPVLRELDSPQGFTDDPVGDEAATLTPGLLQKYAGRALLVTTGACAVHCRYCFRRHFPYTEVPSGVAAWREAVEALAADESIYEVLLSGGDPLTLADATLAQLAEQLAAIPHLRRIRVHSRLPIMIPQRINEELLAWLTGTRLTAIVVIHANHPRELERPVLAAIERLSQAGVMVLNQAVLLAGINDDVDVLAELSERLTDHRVQPYYLHQLDRVKGAAHFEVSRERGTELIRQLRTRLPGYAVPRYVEEIAGEPNKTIIA
ncbi:EF-P beta-lysylation protein EpmB [Blastopirellula retiformator]|uniref:L-lysine 2,3-aminomutase n=1 Tax=Blastopirellula retiformator TaxID=2527970 RepID=A0A5C5VLB1_9BACT|nr:EF-P beta-lysylation protein EpmB [Blastopirellula retiformator]TWT38833.1 L-lysine 2,3-aminomutase [Blastopirellula retiformator]